MLDYSLFALAWFGHAYLLMVVVNVTYSQPYHKTFLKGFRLLIALLILGGPIAFVCDGDRIRIDIIERTLDLLVDEAELASRRVGFTPIPHKYRRGVLAKYAKLVGSASKGAVCD